MLTDNFGEQFGKIDYINIYTGDKYTVLLPHHNSLNTFMLFIDNVMRKLEVTDIFDR